MEFIRFFSLVVLNVILQRHCESARILVILPTDLKSHLSVFKSVVEVLSTEHTITFYSFLPLGMNHENVTEIEMPNIYKSNVETWKIVEESLKYDQFQQMIFFLNSFQGFMEPLLNGKDMIELQSHTEKYDLFITLIFSEALVKLAPVLKIPLIQISPTILPPWTMHAISNNINLGYDINLFTYEDTSTFIGRLKQFTKNIYVLLYYEWVYLPFIENLTTKYFPPGTPTIKEVARNTEGILGNYLSPMGFSRQTTQKVLEIGGLQCRSPRPLPEEMEEFIAGSGEHGVIYFSLGTTLPDVALAKIKTTILTVFKKLPQRILWKFGGAIPDLPPNVKVYKWFPQQDILGHNKTKLFIMQGGILSMQESVYHGVPVLIMPLLMDQFTNCYLAEARGYGKMLTLDKFNENQFYQDIQQLINNPKFRENTKLVSASIRDQSISTSAKLKHWINYIIRHRNSSPFESETEDFSYVQMMELDVIFTIFAVIIILIGIFIYMWLILFKKFTKWLCSKFITKTKLS